MSNLSEVVSIKPHGK
ncbi:MAG: hypothetical protein QXY95_02475, partial [Thermosphaera sp.]